MGGRGYGVGGRRRVVRSDAARRNQRQARGCTREGSSGVRADRLPTHSSLHQAGWIPRRYRNRNVRPSMPRSLLRAAALAALATLVLYAGVPRVRAQSAPAPISAVLIDRDGDLVPDTVGDTVTVAGRITMGSGELHRNWTEVFLQDATGGLKLVASSAAPRVAEGDSVVARGVVEHQNGMAQLTDPVYQVVRGPSRVPAPVPVDLRETTLEAVEGRLVEMKGTVVARGAVEAGEHLIVLVHDQLVVVFAYANRAEPISFDAFEVGDYVRLRGIA